MKQYLDMLRFILENGVDRPNRTGIVARSVLGIQMRFNLKEGFPLVTTKKMAIKSLVAEILGHIRGFDNAADYRVLGTKVWDANANENKDWLNNPYRKGKDDLGRIYGVQWRHWLTPEGKEIDQLAKVIHEIETNPLSRRHVITAWNPAELDRMALPPCPTLLHFYVAGNELSLHLFQRSGDMFLGVPFNIAQYALLLHMVAQVTNLQVGEFVHTISDAHIYHTHFEAVKLQLKREPFPLPKLWLNPTIKNIDDFKPEDIKILNYKCHPAIKAPMAV